MLVRKAHCRYGERVITASHQVVACQSWSRLSEPLIMFRLALANHRQPGPPLQEDSAFSASDPTLRICDGSCSGVTALSTSQRQLRRSGGNPTRDLELDLSPDHFGHLPVWRRTAIYLPVVSLLSAVADTIRGAFGYRGRGSARRRWDSERVIADPSQGNRACRQVWGLQDLLVQQPG